MYPSEMKRYIECRNEKLNREEANYILDVHSHPQLSHITYNIWDCSYDLWDTEGNHFHFTIK